MSDGLSLCVRLGIKKKKKMWSHEELGRKKNKNILPNTTTRAAGDNSNSWFLDRNYFAVKRWVGEIVVSTNRYTPDRFRQTNPEPDDAATPPIRTRGTRVPADDGRDRVQGRKEIKNLLSRAETGRRGRRTASRFPTVPTVCRTTFFPRSPQCYQVLLLFLMPLSDRDRDRRACTRCPGTAKVNTYHVRKIRRILFAEHATQPVRDLAMSHLLTRSRSLAS